MNLNSPSRFHSRLIDYMEKYDIKHPSFNLEGWSANPIIPIRNESFEEKRLASFHNVVKDIFNSLREKGVISSTIPNNSLFLANTCTYIFYELFNLKILDPAEYEVVIPAHTFFAFKHVLGQLNVPFREVDIDLEHINCPENFLFEGNKKYIYIHTPLSSVVSEREIELFKFVKNNGKNLLLLDCTLAKYIQDSRYLKYADLMIYSTTYDKTISLGFGAIVEFYNHNLLQRFIEIFSFRDENFWKKVHNFGYLYIINLLIMLDRAKFFLPKAMNYLEFASAKINSKSVSNMMYVEDEVLAAHGLGTHGKKLKPTFEMNSRFKNARAVNSKLSKIALYNEEVKMDILEKLVLLGKPGRRFKFDDSKMPLERF